MMRENRILRKKAAVALVFFMLLLSLSAYFSNSIKINETRLLNDLKQNVSNGKQLDLNLLNKVCAEIEAKREKNQIITSEEYYLLAYKSRTDYEDADYKSYLLKAYNEIDGKTDNFVKISVYSLISSDLDDKFSNEELVSTFKNTLESLATKEWNDNIYALKNYIEIMTDKIDDRNILIDIYNKPCSQSEMLQSNVSYFLRDSLTIENIIQGNYARAIDLTLQSLWDLEDNPDSFYEARALVNTGLVYYELSDYDTALKYMKKSLDVSIENNEKNIHAKLYALVNLYLIYYDKEDYDSMFENFELIKEYIDEDSASVFKIYEQIAYAKYYLKINDLEKAEEHINLTNDLYEIYGKDGYNDSYLHNAININELNYRKGNINEAIESYKQLFKDTDNRYNAKKRILQNLVNIYTEIYDYENSVKYHQKLIDVFEEESILINSNYSNNLVAMREYENEMQQNRIKRNKSHILIVLVFIVAVLIITSSYFTIKELKRLNKTDGLTKIYNRKYFNEVYEKMLAEKRIFNIIIIDIDNFKFINDTFGHVVGDKVIAGTVSSVNKILNKNDKFFRYGGEEFVIINYDNNKKKLSELCEEIRSTVEAKEWQINIDVTVSIGACSARDGGKNTLIYADECLYESKNTGKNKYTVR